MPTAVSCQHDTRSRADRMFSCFLRRRIIRPIVTVARSLDFELITWIPPLRTCGEVFSLTSDRFYLSLRPRTLRESVPLLFVTCQPLVLAYLLGLTPDRQYYYQMMTSGRTQSLVHRDRISESNFIMVENLYWRNLIC